MYSLGGQFIQKGKPEDFQDGQISKSLYLYIALGIPPELLVTGVRTLSKKYSATRNQHDQISSKRAHNSILTVSGQCLELGVGTAALSGASRNIEVVLSSKYLMKKETRL